MAIKKGDIVLVKFPFTDLSQTKLRPALILYVNLPLKEITLCFISSQNVNELSPEEFPILISDPEFEQTGLKLSSKIRVTRIATVQPQSIIRHLGKLGNQQTIQLNQLIQSLFNLKRI